METTTIESGRRDVGRQSAGPYEPSEIGGGEALLGSGCIQIVGRGRRHRSAPLMRSHDELNENRIPEGHARGVWTIECQPYLFADADIGGAGDEGRC